MVRVLILDDEPSYREYLTRYLTRQQYEVRAAAGRDEALEISQSFCPDVVLADWMLHDRCHGLDVAQTLRQTHAEMQIVLMTGFPTTEIREESRRAGVRSLLEKPFGLEELADAIAEATSETNSGDSAN